jgi:hypothetical protein
MDMSTEYQVILLTSEGSKGRCEWKEFSGLGTLQVYRGGQSTKVDPNLQVMLASNYGVLPASLLSLRPIPHWVSCDLLRYS